MAPEVTIDEREVAEQRCREISSNSGYSSGVLVIFTDGSGYQDRIGAAAVITGSETVQRLSQMGTEEMATVYAAELRGQEMALELAIEDQDVYHRVVVFSDGQAALRALIRPRIPPGQVFLRGCFDFLCQLGIPVGFDGCLRTREPKVTNWLMKQRRAALALFKTDSMTA